MAWPLFSITSKKILGIDIGSSAIKIVELSGGGERAKLENYGILQSKFLYEKPFRTFEKSTLALSTRDIAGAISAILREAKIRTKVANFSLPDFSSFFTTFELPPMGQDEISQAVQFEARQHVPLPIREMALDWVVTGGGPLEQKREKLKILLVAVPKSVVNQYQEISALSGLKLQNLEAEVFALSRALVKEEKGVGVLVDIGAESTTCSVVENGVLKMSHSFDVSGNKLTKALVESLDIDSEMAERLKLKYGLSPAGQVIPKILQPLFDLVIIEIKKISRHFFEREGKNVERVILAGGTANLKGVREYFAEKLKKEIRIGNPFSEVTYPQILERVLIEEGPTFAIAIGVGLGGFL